MATDEAMREPDLSNVGRAWIFKGEPRTIDQTAAVRSWLLRGPWHPAWSAWTVSVVHLRPIDGVHPAHLQFARTSHEFLILSLLSAPGSPEHDPAPDEPETWHPLEPPDVVVQVSGITDEQATEICDWMVQDIVAGNHSPDADWRGFWELSIQIAAQRFRADAETVEG